jgi:hypothetical protein
MAVVYLAGKIKKHCWRHDLVDGLRDVPQPGEAMPPLQWPIMRKSIFGEHDYCGPYFVSCDHGCAHGQGSHGAAAQPDRGEDEEDPYRGCIALSAVYPGIRDGYGARDWVVDLCLTAIDRCDLFFAWIDRPDCHGTLVELGYAKAKGKRIVVAREHDLPDLWFGDTCAQQVFAGYTGCSPKWALQSALMPKSE